MTFGTTVAADDVVEIGALSQVIEAAPQVAAPIPDWPGAEGTDPFLAADRADVAHAVNVPAGNTSRSSAGEERRHLRDQILVEVEEILSAPAQVVVSVAIDLGDIVSRMEEALDQDEHPIAVL